MIRRINDDVSIQTIERFQEFPTLGLGVDVKERHILFGRDFFDILENTLRYLIYFPPYYRYLTEQAIMNSIMNRDKHESVIYFTKDGITDRIDIVEHPNYTLQLFINPEMYRAVLIAATQEAQLTNEYTGIIDSDKLKGAKYTAGYFIGDAALSLIGCPNARRSYGGGFRYDYQVQA